MNLELKTLLKNETLRIFCRIMRGKKKGMHILDTAFLITYKYSISQH